MTVPCEMNCQIPTSYIACKVNNDIYMHKSIKTSESKWIWKISQASEKKLNNLNETVDN